MPSVEEALTTSAVAYARRALAAYVDENFPDFFIYHFSFRNLLFFYFKFIILQSYFQRTFALESLSATATGFFSLVPT